MKPSQLASLLKVTIEKKLPVLITGSPGVGKTDIVTQSAHAAGADLQVFHPVVSDPTDFKGLPAKHATKSMAQFLPFQELDCLIHADKLTVAFLDDLGQAPPAVQAACMQLILARRLNGFSISDNVVFVAATNRRTDKAGVSGLLEPVKSRFATIVPLDVDVDEWVQYALTHDVPTELIGFIRFRPDLLIDFKPTNDLTNTPSPRTVVNVGKLYAAGVPKSIEFYSFAGAAGEGFAAEFTGFLQIYRELPTREQILMAPATAPIPEKPEALYATAAMLAAAASENNFDAIVTYANRMPEEMSVVLVKDALVNKKNLMHTRAFQEWSAKHTQVLI